MYVEHVMGMCGMTLGEPLEMHGSEYARLSGWPREDNPATEMEAHA